MIWQDIIAIGFLVVLEGLLSFDNALALAALASNLPAEKQKKALTYGIFGAFAFRFLALLFITFLLRAVWLKFVGGAYLFYVAFKMLCGGGEEGGPNFTSGSFWKVVVLVELTDITFSMDSILASVGVSPKFYVVLTGGILGIIMMRFVANLFIGLIKRFPGLETSAGLLVFAVGAKMVAEGCGYDVTKFAWAFMGFAFICGFFKPAERKLNE